MDPRPGFLQADSRTNTALEKAYGGLLYVDPETGNSLDVSLGRQTVTLNDGFLIHFVRGARTPACAALATSGADRQRFLGGRQRPLRTLVAQGLHDRPG